MKNLLPILWPLIIKRDTIKYQKQLKNNIPSLEFHYLKSLLEFAPKNIPYYQKYFENKEKLSSHLSSYPIINKKIIHDNFELMYCRNYKKVRQYRNSSGGSTGQPQTYIQDNVYATWNHVTKKYYFKEFLNIEENQVAKVILWGSERDLQGHKSPISRLINWKNKSFYFNSFMMTSEVMNNCVSTINKIKPVLIRGYASSLYAFAQYIKKNNIKIYHPKLIVSSAETMRSFMRKEIESVFNTKLYNFYGSREVGAIAGECCRGMMHIFSFNNHVEILNNNYTAVTPDENGRVIITNLHNYSMSLIRYEIGDMAIRAKACSCGSKLPVLKEITGRVTDNFITADKEIVHGEYFTHLFYFKDWVKEFQVVQNDYKDITISVTMHKKGIDPPADDINDINNQILLVMGKDCKIHWSMVDNIPKTPQGKLLFTLSNIHE